MDILERVCAQEFLAIHSAALEVTFLRMRVEKASESPETA